MAAPTTPAAERSPRPLVGALTVLTAGAVLLGRLPWPRPERTPSGWQVTAVPGSLWALMIGSGLVCLTAGMLVTRRPARFRVRTPLGGGWGALVLLAASALVWHGLHSAAVSATEPGPVIPVFLWLFTFAPALLAAGLFTRRDHSERRAAALGTGVVTVPLLALSWALLDPSGLSLGSVGRAVYDTAVFGIAPLALAVALAGAMGRPGASSAPPV
jgi:hypothetical protein